MNGITATLNRLLCHSAKSAAADVVAIKLRLFTCNKSATIKTRYDSLLLRRSGARFQIGGSDELPMGMSGLDPPHHNNMYLQDVCMSPVCLLISGLFQLFASKNVFRLKTN